MHTRQWSALLAVVAACLFFAGCGDSKYPLSDPLKSKADAAFDRRLAMQTRMGT